MVTALAAVGAGAWGLQRWAPFSADANAPTWPDNVAPLVDYVEEATGQHFVDQVLIEYIAKKSDYVARVQAKPIELTVADRKAAATDEAVGRALGLWAGDASMTEMREAIDSADPIPVTWLAEENTIVINAKDRKTGLSPLLRARMTVRLTQALDDQLFHTFEQIQRAATSQEYQSLVAISVGHAVWVHDLYVADLSDDDIDEYYAASDESDADWADATADVPVSYQAIRSVGQQVGPMFIEVLSERGHSLVAKALTTDVPAALDQISLPVSKYLRRDTLESVSAPPGPAAADVQYTNQMGPFATYLLFSTGLPLNVALTTSDGWGNDRYTAYVLDGRVCVDVHLVADSRDDADRLANGLNGWAQARPAEANALVGRSGNDLYATVCDPGTAVDQSVPTEAAVQQYVARAQEIQFRADLTGDPELAECVAVGFFAAHDVDTLDESFDFFTEFDNIEQDCLATL